MGVQVFRAGYGNGCSRNGEYNRDVVTGREWALCSVGSGGSMQVTREGTRYEDDEEGEKVWVAATQ